MYGFFFGCKLVFDRFFYSKMADLCNGRAPSKYIDVKKLFIPIAFHIVESFQIHIVSSCSRLCYLQMWFFFFDMCKILNFIRGSVIGMKTFRYWKMWKILVDFFNLR